jgi:hypothetical protein
MKQPDGLLSVLRDANAAHGDRSDAAMDLAAFDHPDVRVALAEVATAAATDPDIAEDCAESLAQIWCRTGEIDTAVLSQLHGSARDIAVRVLETQCPGLTQKEDGG